MATNLLLALFKSTGESHSPIYRVIAGVRTRDSQEQLRIAFSQYSNRVDVVFGDNVHVAREADILLLAHKPYLLSAILGHQEVSQALKGKLLVSIMAGVTTDQIHTTLYGTKVESQATILRAMPNMGAQVGQSMTAIAEPPSHVAAEHVQQATWLFEQAGKVIFVPDSLFNLATVLVGACIALTTICVDGILDAAVSEGMTRPQAQRIVGQCLLGTGALLNSGSHPALLREAISSPRGCSIKAITKLESTNTRSAFTDAITEATKHADSMSSHQEHS